MRHLVLVRHGESEWNVERRIQGQAGTGLSPRGSDQAGRTARHLAEVFPDAHLLTSDLQRCRETAVPLEAELGRPAQIEKGLRERHFGDWTGMLVSEVEQSDPDRWERWHAGTDVVGEVGGESTAEFAARVDEVLGRILDDLDHDEAAICVTHGGPVWHGTHALLGLAHGTLGGVANASVTEIVVDGGGERRLATWNQVGHLPYELRTGILRALDGRRRSAGQTRDAPAVGT